MRRVFLGFMAVLFAFAALPAMAQQSDVTLRVAGWGGEFNDLLKKYVGSRLTHRTGIKIEYVLGNPADFLAQMVASRGRQAPFDVVFLDEAVQADAIKAGVLGKLDPVQVPNLKRLYPQAQDPNGYGPSINFYSVGIAYNRDKLKAAGLPVPKSWKDLWDPRYADHLALPDISLIQGRDFVIKIAKLNGGDEHDLKPGLDKIAELRPKTYWMASAMLESLLLSGDIWVTVWHSARSWNLIDRGAPLAYVVPEEGGVGNVDMVDMVAGTSHPKEAQLFLNMVIDPVTQMGYADELFYGPSNTSLQSALDAYPEMARKFPASPKDLENYYLPDWTAFNANLKQATDYWNRAVKH